MKKMYAALCVFSILLMSVSSVHAQVSPVTFTQETYEAREGTSARISLKLTQPVTKTTRVKIKVVAGTARAGVDFVPSTPTITFYKNGLQTKSIVVPIKSDRITEGAETIVVSVVSVDNRSVPAATAPKATLAIVDSSTPGNPTSTTCTAPQIPQGSSCVDPTSTTCNLPNRLINNICQLPAVCTGGQVVTSTNTCVCPQGQQLQGGVCGSQGGGTGQSGYKWLGRTGANFSPAPPICTAPVPVEGAACTAGSTMCTVGAITFACLPPGSTAGSITACLKPVESRNCNDPVANNDNLIEYDIYTLNGSVENISGGPVGNIFTGLNLNQNIPGALLGGPTYRFGQERISATTDGSGNVEYKVIMATGKRISGAGAQLAPAKSTDDVRRDIESRFSFFRGFVGRSSGGGPTEERIIPSLAKVELENTGSTAFRLKNKTLVTSMGPVANYATNGTVSFVEQQGTARSYRLGPNAQYCLGEPEFFNLRSGQFKTRFDQLVSRVEGGSLRIDTDRRYIDLGSCSFVEDYKAFSSIPGATYDAPAGKWRLLGDVPGTFIIDGQVRYRLGGTL